MTTKRTEDKWWAKLHFKLFGVWPQSVVEERLAEYDANVADVQRSWQQAEREL